MSYKSKNLKSLLLIHFLIQISIELSPVSPNWVTSNYVLAASHSVINGASPTDQTTTPIPSAIMTFSTAFAQAPNLGYGITHYEGDDNLGEEMYEVERLNLTPTYFNVQVKISGNTGIWVVTVRYIAISKSFPHHVNSFDNVPVNYSKGALTQFATRTVGLIYYSNTINYTTQASAISSPYTTFSTPLSNNKILLFMTSMYFDGKSDSSPPLNPVDLRVNATIETTDTYKINLAFGSNAIMTRLHYSMIIFDQIEVQYTGKYQIIYQTFNFSKTGGSIAVPQEFVPNCILGFTSFSSQRTESLIHFNLNFQVLSNGSYGINMPTAVPRPSSKVPINYYGYTLFYLKTWSCPNISYFFDIGSQFCVGCTLLECVQCINSTHCRTCNASNGYIVNNSGLCQKIPCTLPQCLMCIALGQCGQCNVSNSYYLLGNGTCEFCDNSLNQFINATTQTCETCNLFECQKCQSLTECSQCKEYNNYFLNSADKLCYFCTIADCNVCESLNRCQICSNTTMLINSTGKCAQCSIEGCINCLNFTSCGQCNISDNYVLLSNYQCQKCPNNTFANISDQCQNCSIDYCLTCSSLTDCQLCNTSASYYLLPNKTCQYCNESLNYFINSSNLQCELCSISYCLQCSDLNNCEVCDNSTEHFLNISDRQCYPCQIPNCLKCFQLNKCEVCNQSAQYFLNHFTFLCEPCSLWGCLNCSSLNQCQQCDVSNDIGFDFSQNKSTCGPCQKSCICDGYTQPWNPVTQKCTPQCGDGLIRLQQECDDNNNDSFDGCSVSCKIQSYYACVGEPSNCSKTLYIEAQFISIEKQGCNQFKATVRTQKYKLQQIKNNIVILNEGITIENIVEVQQNIHIHCSYQRDIVHQNVLIFFSPGDLLSVGYNPLTPALYYSSKQCESNENVRKLLLATQIMSYMTLFFSLFSCKIIGLELFGLLQLSYFTLASHDFLNSYLAPLANFKSFNGYNAKIASQTSDLPAIRKQMGMSGSFINNCNVMLIILAAWILFSCGLLLISKLVHSHTLQRYSKHLLKQGYLTLIIFSSFNISYSAGMHYKYADKSDNTYVLSSLVMAMSLLAMLISIIMMEVTATKTYGQFKSKFKQNWTCKMFIPATILYRMALGFYSAVESQNSYSTLLILAFSFTFVLYYLINTPYKDWYHNYRSCFVHCAMLTILLITNYYRTMKSTTPLQIKAKIHSPALLQLSLIISCLFVSIVVLIYDTYLRMKLCKQSVRVQPQISQINKTEQSILAN